MNTLPHGTLLLTRSGAHFIVLPLEYIATWHSLINREQHTFHVSYYCCKNTLPHATLLVTRKWLRTVVAKIHCHISLSYWPGCPSLLANFLHWNKFVISDSLPVIIHYHCLQDWKTHGNYLATFSVKFLNLQFKSVIKGLMVYMIEVVSQQLKKVYYTLVPEKKIMSYFYWDNFQYIDIFTDIFQKMKIVFIYFHPIYLY